MNECFKLMAALLLASVTAAQAAETGTEKLVPSFYGVLKPRLGVGGGYFVVDDIASRLGISISHELSAAYGLTAVYEAGVNLSNQNNVLFETGKDVQISQGVQPVSTRQGYAGVKTPYGALTMGKQWSVYYDVAGMADMFETFGGMAAGAYSVGDGGISGTGRAEKALVYRGGIGPVKLGLQAQMRNRTGNSKKFGDSLGAALKFEQGRWIAGIASNKVRDGLAAPLSNEPKAGDEALVAGLSYSGKGWTASATASKTTAHEKDDLGNWFGARGEELYLMKELGTKFRAVGGFNHMRPRRSDSGFRLMEWLAGVSYRTSTTVSFNTELRYANNKGAQGDRTSSYVTLALGMDIAW